VRIEVDGQPVGPEAARMLALAGYWHFTAIQVRNTRARGMDLHLARLAEGNRELFDAPLDEDEVRRNMRSALGDTGDASVRVMMCRPGPDEPIGMIVTVRPPAQPPARPQRLRVVDYLRPVPHIKHSGGFGQTYHRQKAHQEGFDEILLTAPDGTIAEAGIANVGFVDDHGIVWPDGPMLRGTAMALLQRALGGTARTKTITVAEIEDYRGMFVTNSHGVAAVACVDDVQLRVEPVDDLNRLYAETPWDEI
jgi:branched-subunit amino acid aminotransferase/4-amino-4-deoxychorismate lyase